MLWLSRRTEVDQSSESYSQDTPESSVEMFRKYPKGFVVHDSGKVKNRKGIVRYIFRYIRFYLDPVTFEITVTVWTAASTSLTDRACIAMTLRFASS